MSRGLTQQSVFLFAVARWGQRNAVFGRVDAAPVQFLFAVARWGQRNMLRDDLHRSVVGPKFLFAVARWGQRNLDAILQQAATRRVSIRCREMGTAGTFVSISAQGVCTPFLFAVARWGQRNAQEPVAVVEVRFYSLSRDGDSGTSASQPLACGTTGFLFAAARWGQRNTACVVVC